MTFADLRHEADRRLDTGTLSIIEAEALLDRISKTIQPTLDTMHSREEADALIASYKEIMGKILDYVELRKRGSDLSHG